MGDAGVQVGVETEMILSIREPPQGQMPDLERFAKGFARHYNGLTKGSKYPRMHTDIDGTYEGMDVNTEWSVTDDQSVSPTSSGPNNCELYVLLGGFAGESR